MGGSGRDRGRERFLPFGGLVGPARLFVKLHESPHGLIQPWLTLLGKAPLLQGIAGNSNLVFTLLQALVAREQERLGFGVFFLPQQTATEQAPGVERSPIVGDFLSVDSEALTGRR